MSAVHVCPLRDIECGDNIARWCHECPKWSMEALRPGPLHFVPSPWKPSQREFFAAMAMQGLLSNLEAIRREGFMDRDIEEFAIIRADALIAILNEPQP